MTIRGFIVFALAILALFTVASHARAQDNNPFSGARSITVDMHRVETCTASQYGTGDGYGGKRTASGEIMRPSALTAAHRTRRLGSSVTVTNVSNGRAVNVRINDRGPFVKGRCIDLSRAAANAIGMGGLARVTVE
jgi:rare lipoprotein A (peptidoglycan hydrolase)